MFNRLTIWQRLAVLSAAFLIPVLALLYFLGRTVINSATETAEGGRDGRG
jgi:hypothetical protein